MKRLWGAAILVMVGVSTIALAGEPALAVKVPFDFYVGTKLVPAGEYVIESSRPGLAVIRDKKSGDCIAAVSTIPVKATHEVTERVVFHRQGNQHFLVQLWWVDSAYGQQVVNAR